MKLEVVDKMRICQVKVATIKHITGKRLYLEYDDFDTDDNGELWMDRENEVHTCIQTVHMHSGKLCRARSNEW